MQPRSSGAAGASREELETCIGLPTVLLQRAAALNVEARHIAYSMEECECCFVHGRVTAADGSGMPASTSNIANASERAR